MNAFMLFAQKFRLEITQAHPGKDNRYRQIESCLLSWMRDLRFLQNTNSKKEVSLIKRNMLYV